MSDDHDRAITTWLNRTADVARELAEQYAALAGYVVRDGSGGGDGTNIRGTKVHAEPPIRVEVVALRDDIAAVARRYADLVRGTLRMGLGDGPSTTPDRLVFIAGTFGRLHPADPDLTEEVADAVWRHHRKASRVIDPVRGTIRRPFRIEDACPECGLPSLWVDPARWVIACGMPSCGGRWGIDQPVLAGSSATAGRYQM